MWMAILKLEIMGNTPKHAKYNNLLKTKQIVNAKIQAS